LTGSRRAHVKLYGDDLRTTQKKAVVWLEMLCTVAVKLTEDVSEGPTGAGHQRGVHVKHTRVFSGLPEILFNDRLDTSRGKSDSIEHTDKLTPEGEQGGAGDVLTSA
jgi:hypothetical protein